MTDKNEFLGLPAESGGSAYYIPIKETGRFVIQERDKGKKEFEKMIDDPPKYKSIEIDGRRYVLLGCFQCPFWHDEGVFIKCQYPHEPSRCLEKSKWSYPDDCPLEDAKKRKGTDKRWAVVKKLNYTVPAGSSENIQKGVKELTLKILTTEDLKPQIKDFMDRKEGSTLRLLDTLSRIAIEPKTEEEK